MVLVKYFDEHRSSIVNFMGDEWTDKFAKSVHEQNDLFIHVWALDFFDKLFEGIDFSKVSGDSSRFIEKLVSVHNDYYKRMRFGFASLVSVYSEVNKLPLPLRKIYVYVGTRCHREKLEEYMGSEWTRQMEEASLQYNDVASGKLIFELFDRLFEGIDLSKLSDASVKMLDAFLGSKGNGLSVYERVRTCFSILVTGLMVDW
jgi:hypothetical protein